jgi:hypothetical protein
MKLMVEFQRIQITRLRSDGPKIGMVTGETVNYSGKPSGRRIRGNVLHAFGGGERHQGRIGMTQPAVGVGGRRERTRAPVFSMTEGAPCLPGRIRLMKVMTRMAFQAGAVHSAPISGPHLNEPGNLPGCRLGLESGGQDSVRTGVAGPVAGAASGLVRDAVTRPGFTKRVRCR